MFGKETSLYRENHTKRVAYNPTWLNAHFCAWLEKIYGDSQKPLDHWASAVSIFPGDGQAKSLPTGGRALVYDLPQPYLDPKSQLPCYQIDVKGVGLTKSGYHQLKPNIQHNLFRQEIMLNLLDDFLGILPLDEAVLSAKDLRLARRQHILAPIPVAVLELKQLVYRGARLSIKQLTDSIGMTPEALGLLIRAYPVTATRLSDLTSWIETPYHFGDGYRQDTASSINSIKLGRFRFQKYELPKILAAFSGQLDTNPGLLYYRWYQEQAVNQVVTMFSTGLTPCSGNEDGGSSNHVHLQNHTTSDFYVEWTPLRRIDSLYQPFLHYETVIEAEHDALTNIGAVCLAKEDLHQLISLAKFKRQVFANIRRRDKNSFLRQLERKTYSPHNRSGRGDSLIDFVSGITNHLD